MKKFALLGHHIAYSLSPFIHNMVYAHMGVSAAYGLVSLEPDNFDSAVQSLFCLDGFNVTKPYKNRIVDFLDSVANPRFDAVNTVVIKNARRIGYNTDYDGVLVALMQLADFRNKSVLVLGAGGVADSVVAALCSLKANAFIYNRTAAAAISLANKYGVGVASDKKGQYDAVINCTSYGLNVGENIGEGLDLSNTQLVYDTIYFDTALLKMAKLKGVPIIANGLSMLVYQALTADELFFDTPIVDKEILAQKILQQLRKEQKA